MPALSPDIAGRLVTSRHPIWTEFNKHWRWLYDSYEGGDRYRFADYFRGPFEPWVDPLYAFGWDETTGQGLPFTYGMIVQRNLVPHATEKSKHGIAQYMQRLDLTPVPGVVDFVIERWLSRVFAGQITRVGPPALEAWWADCDGQGVDASCWFRGVVGPLLLALGQLDVVFGRPGATPEEQAQIATKADLARLKLDGLTASYIMPENMVWWRLGRGGQYLECLVHDRDEAGNTAWRHWTETESNCYTTQGVFLPAKSFVHGFGQVPIVRLFDKRLARCPFAGVSRVKQVAERQKSIYNRSSELHLNDVQQSHAQLMGPEDFLQADNTIPVGPGDVLPMKRNSGGDGGASYQGWEYIDAPKGGPESLRQNISDDIDEVLRVACILKPAGTAGAGTVGQSGLSKAYDSHDQNSALASVAQTLGDAETKAARLAAALLGVPETAEIAVEYPSEFDLTDPADVAAVLAEVQTLAAQLGLLPETETEILQRVVTSLLPGIGEGRLAELHEEIAQAAQLGAQRMTADPATAAPGGDGGGTLGTDGNDAGGASGTGQNSTQDPSITLPPDASLAMQALNSILAPDFA
jgi:hypothetical protein